MTRVKRASPQRSEQTPARAKGEVEREAEQYAGAFARVRLVRAWIAALAAIVAVLSTFLVLLERVVRW